MWSRVTPILISVDGLTEMALFVAIKVAVFSYALLKGDFSYIYIVAILLLPVFMLCAGRATPNDCRPVFCAPSVFQTRAPAT